MKFKVSIFTLLFSFTCLAKETMYFNDLIARATPKEKANMAKMLKEISIVPFKEPKTGETVFKVTYVAKGSTFARQGVKVGDLIRSNKENKKPTL